LRVIDVASADVSNSPDVSEFEEAADSSALRQALVRTQRQLAQAKAKTEHLVEATLQGARDAMAAMGPVRPVPAPKADRRKRPEAAIWDLGDWQGSKLTPTYNSEVMRERVLRYCAKAARITEVQRADHPVRHCTVIFGGDMVEGLFNFATQPFEIDATLFGQYVTVSRLLVDVVRSALALYETVTVVPEWGNHGRIGTKRSAVVRPDNVDRMCFEFGRQLLEDESRLTWPDCPEDIQRLEVGNYRAIVLHGDEPGRTGFVSPTAMVQYVTRLQSGAYGWDFRDAYVHHYHNHSEYALPNGRGSVYYNGSTESDNRYARDGMAATAIPSQRLHFVDPEAGRVTCSYKVWLA
jgi:hypothetical protein